MKYSSLTVVSLVLLSLSVSCANPADNAPKAVISGTATPAIGARASGTRLVITPSNSRIDFIGSKVTGSESGWFKQFSGLVELVAENPVQSQVSIEIDMNSVATKSQGLDEHLKTADFFEVARYPKATFVSTSIKSGSEAMGTHTVTGNLELHGVQKAITFPATINVTADAVSVDSEFAINRKDFGIVYAGKTNDLIRDEVVLKLTIKAGSAGL